MLVQFKIYLIAILYFIGALFMLLFPPRNYKQSGAKMRMTRSIESSLKYTKYVDDNEVQKAVERLAREDPDVVRVVPLTPRTAQNRTVIALELRSDKQSRKPGILIIAALNGMAWAAPNAVLELAEKLLYDTNYQTPFFNDYDWYLIPIGNPDGLRFTQRIRDLPPLNAFKWAGNLTVQTRTRPEEWHKNVDKDSKENTCFGTNINRNFAFHWQDYVEKRSNRCMQWFPGDKPFSTSEAQGIRTYVGGLGENIQLAIHLHASFEPKKEFMLFPWRYSKRRPSNYHTLQNIGEYAARLSRLPDGRVYEVHQSSNDDSVAGSLLDYLSGVVGIELVYLLKPYHQKYPNFTDVDLLRDDNATPMLTDTYVQKATAATLSLVRGWRRSTNQNTLSFFGRDVEF